MRSRHLITVVIVFAGLVSVSANRTRADSPGLVGHWTLAGDTRDDSDQSNHGKAFGVDLAKQGPGRTPNSAARFDGKTSRVEIASRSSLKFGSDNFTIALWVNTARELDDALGDLISKYDPVTRRGLNFSIQINGMVVYRGQLYAGSMYAPAGFFRYEGGSKWTPCGTPDGKRVESLTVYNGHIYATGYDEGAVYRYDGDQWERVGLLEGANQTYGFATYRGDLYVSEWPHAKVFRWNDKRSWLPAGRLGDQKETMPLMVYNGKLYGGTLPSAEVYRYDDPFWQQIGRLDFTPDVRYRRVWSMAVYRGRLFAGTLPSGRVHSIEIGRNVTYDQALPSGWVHVAAVRDGNRLRLHVAGKLVATSPAYTNSPFDIANDVPLLIGFGAHDHFNGQLSDVRLYNRALSAVEIAPLAKRGTSR